MEKIFSQDQIMKKEYAFLFIAVAFVAGIVAGVIATVLYEEKMPVPPPSIKPSQSSPAPAITADIQKQITMLQGVLKEDPKNLKALVELGNLYFDTEQADSAIQIYARALELDPKNPDVRTDMGIMYRRKGDPDRALAEFRKAAQDDPKHVNSRYNTGVVLLHDKADIKGAIKAWEEYLKVEPTGPRAENIRSQMEKMRNMAK
jgi:cytochrome c-type biogenesis protein CcmH/NrfG